MAGDIRGTTTTITSNLNCYTACPNQQGLGSVSVLDSTGIFSLCSACPSNSTYDLIKNKCITDCPSNYEPRENTNGMFCSKYCTMDPSGNPMTWADPVTKTECRTANFPGTSGETRLIVDSNAIKTMSYTSSMQFTSNKPFGVAIIKSMDVFTNFWRNPNINVIDYRKMGEYQTSGRARLLFQYFYDNTSNLRSTTQSSGIVNRTSINLITTSRPTTQKRIVPMTIDPTNTDGGYLYINRTGTQRRYQIYLDWTDMTDTTKRFYADTSNPVYVYGRSYSQSISLGTARTSAPVFPLPTNPFDQGSCPPGYTDLGTSVANPCKQNKPTDATEVGSNYIQNCPAGYTAISDTQCKRDCTGLYEVHNDNQCRIRPPTTNYALSEDGTKWILCSGNDPNNIPYKYENNSGKYVFNSLCYEQNNPSIPTGEKMNVQPEQIGYNFSPFDRGLWEWYYNWRWVEQWQGFNNANTFVNGTYSRLPGCSTQCVTQKPPNAATQQDIWPYFVHTYASFNGNWGRLPSERWAWVSDTDARAVNGGLLYDRGIETDGRNSWRNNRGHWSYRNIFFDGQNNNGPMNRYLRENKSRWIYTKTPDDIQNVTYIPRDLLNRVSNPIDYVPRV
jgi:hypothetical protein